MPMTQGKRYPQESMFHHRHRPLVALSALALTAICSGQGTFNLDKGPPAGTLGASLRLNISNAPTGLVLLFPSLSAGPTPVSIVDPSDPRSLNIGLDLATNLVILVANGFGQTFTSLPLPGDPTFNGTVLHWQAVTLGTTSLVGDISNNVVAQLGTPGTNLLAPATLGAARSFSAILDLPNGDALIAGGGGGTLTSASGLASTERWNFRTMSRQPGPNMTTSRALHDAVELADGRWLLIGGANSAGSVLSSCEIYDPSTNSFSSTGSMGTPRILHAATRLFDGRVLVVGGTNTLVDVTSTISGTLDSAEVYNPASGTWSGTADIGGFRLAPALTTLSNGVAMVSGGVEVSFFFGFPTGASSTTNVQFYSPGSNSWSGGPGMTQGRAGHHYNQVTMSGGRVLMTGGVNVTGLLTAQNAGPTASAEYYTVGGGWTSSTMPQARSLHTATALQNGNVAVCGGAQGTLLAPAAINNVNLFNPVTNSWSNQPGLLTPKSGHAAYVQPDGLLVLFGGQGATTTSNSISTLHY